MEEEVMNQQGMMSAEVQPTSTPDDTQQRLVGVLGDRVENNLQNLNRVFDTKEVRFRYRIWS